MNFSDHKQTAKEYKIGGGDFWRPENGDNRVRILSGYEVYGFHWNNTTKKGGICIGKDNNCQWCAEGNKPAAKFLMWAIKRRKNENEEDEIIVMQVGYTVVQQLGDLQLSPDWGFEGVPDYDVVIKKTGEKLETKYFVTPTPQKSPLTADEQEAILQLKDLKGLIGKMKEKAGGSPDVIQVEEQLNPASAPDEATPMPF